MHPTRFKTIKTSVFITFFQSVKISGALRVPKTTTQNPKIKIRFCGFRQISVFECVIFSKIFEKKVESLQNSQIQNVKLTLQNVKKTVE